MIVTCEKCSTRFRLDDSRVPPQGARVRCSRCQHAFFVQCPGASDEELAEGLARELLRSTAAPSPRAPARSSSGKGSDEESDWQFNEDPAAPEAPQARRGRPSPAVGGEDLAGAAASPTPGPRAAPAGPRTALDELGSPEDWNLLSDQPGASGPAAEPAVEAHPLPAPVAAAAEPAWQTVDEAEGEEPAGAVGPTRLARGVGAVAWAGVSLLFLAAALGSLLPRSAGFGGAAAAEVAGLRLEAVRGRVVENAAAGRLFVVSGRLVNAGESVRAPGQLLAVRLLDAAGRPLREERAPVGPVLDPVRVREEPPDQLARAQAEASRALAWTALAPGEALAFAALFQSLPAEAVAFDFEGSPAPPRSAASPPSPLPSSE